MAEVILTVDGVVITSDFRIVLIKRAKEPEKDKLVLPGGHVNEDDQNTKVSCVRELEEEISLCIKPDRLQFLMMLDELGRDFPRPGRRISIAYLIIINNEEINKLRSGDDAKEIIIREIDSIKKEEIGFDHYLAILKIKEMFKHI